MSAETRLIVEPQPHHWDLRPVDDIVAGEGLIRRLVISVEVPRLADGTELERRGRRYYPTMAAVELYTDKAGEDGGGSLTADECRSLAAKLIAAAEKIEAIDRHDEDECGHWWPCDCGATR